MDTVSGTCVAIDNHGVLLRGPSGAGKSDLALRLIADGARLIADDQVRLEAADGRLVARAPEMIRHMLEVRGLGILRLDALASTNLVAVVDLVDRDAVERMPEPVDATLLGVTLPLYRIWPFEVSASHKVRLAVALSTGGIMVVR